VNSHEMLGRREPQGQVMIYGGAIAVSVENKRDGLIRLSFDNGHGHPATWDFTPEQAGAIHDLLGAAIIK
jgi:hypothetical protein